MAGPHDPLVAVFRRSIRLGNPSGCWMYLIVRSSPETRPKLLGTISWTEGGRFVYFPGTRSRVESTHQDGRLNGRELDHVTLEIDASRTRWVEHVVVLGGGRNHGQSRRGELRGEPLHPWFSLLLPSLETYGDVPARFTHTFDVPTSDKNRRALAIMGGGMSRSALVFPPAPHREHFYQLDVWAGRGPGWTSRNPDALPWSSQSHAVENHRGEPVLRSASKHELGGDQGVAIVLTRPSGTLKMTGLVHMGIG